MQFATPPNYSLSLTLLSGLRSVPEVTFGSCRVNSKWPTPADFWEACPSFLRDADEGKSNKSACQRGQRGPGCRVLSSATIFLGPCQSGFVAADPDYEQVNMAQPTLTSEASIPDEDFPLTQGANLKTNFAPSSKSSILLGKGPGGGKGARTKKSDHGSSTGVIMQHHTSCNTNWEHQTGVQKSDVPYERGRTQNYLNH